MPKNVVFRGIKLVHPTLAREALRFIKNSQIL